MSKIYWIVFCIGLLGVISPGAALADSVGDQALFNVDPTFDFKQRSELFASLRAASNQLYFYVEDEWWGTLTPKERADVTRQTEELAGHFGTEIYPRITATFGKENTPGVDNEAHITVLIHRMKNQLKGYFNTGDGYTKFESPGSNEREMVYLANQTLADPLAPSYLAHEFTHLVYFNQKQIINNTKDEVWIQEGFAEMGPTLAGYNDVYEGSYLERRVRDFLSGPRDSLVEWRGLGVDYGVVNMFFQYLLDQYGKQFLVDALHAKQGGIASLQEALAMQGIRKDFSDVFGNWVLTMFLNDCSYGREYCFQNENLKDIRVAPFTNFLSSVGETQLTVTNETKNWAANWHKISGGGGELEVLFDGNPHAKFVVPYLVQNKEGSYSIGKFVLGEDQKGTVRVSGFGAENQAVVILPFAHQETAGFDERNPSYFFSWTVSTDSGNAPAVSQEPTTSSKPFQSVASLLEQIAFLQAQVVMLQQQIGISVPAPPEVPSLAFECTFQQNLSTGATRSNEVKCLQEFLKQQGADIYPESLVTGNFLQLTQAAVVRFQEKYRAEILEPLGLEHGTGYVGSATRKKIQELMDAEQLVLTISASGV